MTAIEGHTCGAVCFKVGGCVPDDSVLVSRSVLAAYVTEYHHHGRMQRCTSDGQEWPCDTYKEIRRALDT